MALLVPMPDSDSTLSRLIASGRATAPVGDLCDLPPPLRRRQGKPLSRIVEDLREERL